MSLNLDAGTKNFFLLATGIDTRPVLEQLAENPQLWNEHTYRKASAGSPHAQMDDIWVRYRKFEELNSPASFNEPHLAEFYPAWRTLSGLRPIVMGLFAHTQCTYLGGVLITRIPPGGKILPHHDRGAWHAEYHNVKVYVPLQSNSGCVNICEDEQINMQTGDAWTFDNLRTHSVENNGDTDRITLIISMRYDA